VSSLKSFRVRAHALVDQLADHLERAESGNITCIPYQSPTEAYAFWEKFEGDESDLFEAVLSRSTSVHHPGYIGHQVSVPSTPGILASWVSDLLNNGSAVYEMGMAANAIEGRVAKEMGATFGFPIAIVGMACSTSTGSYDDLQLIARFAHTHKLWFHVDAAHGGVACFSESEKHKVIGIDLADSLTLDAHKMMQVPALTTLLLYRDELSSYRTFSQQADYLWGNDGPEWYHSGQRTLECTKMMMGMRMLSVTMGDGMTLLSAYVERQYSLARAFAKTLQERPFWEVAVEPMSNIVCFRHIPSKNPKNEAIDKHNAAARSKLLHDGRWYVVSTKLKGSYWLRCTLMNSLTTLETLKEMLDFVESD